MNREIKFRAWDNENKYMVTSKQGVFTALRNSMNIVRQDDGYYNDGDLLKTNKEKYTLMQFTGMFDKNGKEIYEGDIVRIIVNNNIEKICKVEFKNGIFGVMFSKNKDLTAFPHFCNTTFEVIGNIYDNPELLGGE